MDYDTAFLCLTVDGPWSQRLRAAVIAHLRERWPWITRDPPETLAQACIDAIDALSLGEYEARVNGVPAWRFADAYNLRPIAWAARRARERGA